MKSSRLAVKGNPLCSGQALLQVRIPGGTGPWCLFHRAHATASQPARSSVTPSLLPVKSVCLSARRIDDHNRQRGKCQIFIQQLPAFHFALTYKSHHLSTPCRTSHFLYLDPTKSTCERARLKQVGSSNLRMTKLWSSHCLYIHRPHLFDPRAGLALQAASPSRSTSGFSSAISLLFHSLATTLLLPAYFPLGTHKCFPAAIPFRT
jgi:hypothetical protein